MKISVKCPNCFQQVTMGDDFCPSCGYKLNGPGSLIYPDPPKEEKEEAPAEEMGSAAGSAAPAGGFACPNGHEVRNPSLGFCEICGAPLVSTGAGAGPAPDRDLPRMEPVREPVHEPVPAPAPEPVPVPEPMPAPAPAPVPRPAPAPEPEPAPVAAVTCPSCGKTFHDPELRYCPECGVPLFMEAPSRTSAGREYDRIAPAAYPEPSGYDGIPVGMRTPRADDLSVKANYGKRSM